MSLKCAAMLPHDSASRASSFGQMDASAQIVADATLADLDPLERDRLRQSVQQYGGDQVLLDRDDEALDGALGWLAKPEQPCAVLWGSIGFYRFGCLMAGRVSSRWVRQAVDFQGNFYLIGGLFSGVVRPRSTFIRHRVP